MNILENLPNSLAANIPLKEVVLQAGIAGKAKSLCVNLGKTLLVCDENTKDFVKLDGEKIILPAKQKAELAKAQELAKNSCDYFIAVGSGSLNDMVKYAAFLAGKSYVVFGTAPSMNGYCSLSSSLLENGYKKSFAARPPEKVYLDLEILENAPKRLINSGIGDSICRSTVEADLQLSHQIKNTPLHSELMQLLRENEEKIFDDIAALTKMLVYGGLAMLLAGSSAPASQGEHMLAHYMELMQNDAPQSYHGEQIAVTTLTMAKLQEKLLQEKDHAEIADIDSDKIFTHFGREFGEYCLTQAQKKYSGIIGKKIKLDKRTIEKNLLSAQNLHKKLKAIGAPLQAKDIGWKEPIYNDASQYTKYTRDRFTFLDLV